MADEYRILLSIVGLVVAVIGIASLIAAIVFGISVITSDNLVDVAKNLGKMAACIASFTLCEKIAKDIEKEIEK